VDDPALVNSEPYDARLVLQDQIKQRGGTQNALLTPENYKAQ